MSSQTNYNPCEEQQRLTKIFNRLADGLDRLQLKFPGLTYTSMDQSFDERDTEGRILVTTNIPLAEAKLRFDDEGRLGKQATMGFEPDETLVLVVKANGEIFASGDDKFEYHEHDGHRMVKNDFLRVNGSEPGGVEQALAFVERYAEERAPVLKAQASPTQKAAALIARLRPGR